MFEMISMSLFVTFFPNKRTDGNDFKTLCIILGWTYNYVLRVDVTMFGKKKYNDINFLSNCRTAYLLPMRLKLNRMKKKENFGENNAFQFVMNSQPKARFFW